MRLVGSRLSRTFIGGLAGASAVLLSAVSPIAATADTSGSGDGIGNPQFTTDSTAPPGLRTTNTIPYWSSTFTDPTNGVTYPYTMVGTSPYTTNASTTIPTVIIPLSFTFEASASPNPTLDGSTRLNQTIDSPIFQSTADIGAAADATASAAPAGVAPSPRIETEPSDTTQLGDAFFRSQFGKTGSGYHVLLGQPSVLPTQSFTVPSHQGVLVVGSRSHARIGLIDVAWFSPKLQSLMGSLHLDPHTLPIFLTYNTFLYIVNTGNCCILGYHGSFSPVTRKIGGTNGNGSQPIQTFIFTAYNDPGIFGTNPGDSFSYIQDVHALSHEVSEWLDDPFTDNLVNPWLTPTAPQYGCTGILEVGDPVVGFGFSVGPLSNGITYHPEDEVFFSWFARQSPSIASSGTYTYLNNFATVAHGC